MLANKGFRANHLDSHSLRASHFQLGDNSQAPSSQYETTYGTTMKYRENPVGHQKGPTNFKSSSTVTINGDGNNSYHTESRSK